MRLRPFEYHEPTTAEEAVALLAEYGEEARPVAGGTALVPMIRFGLLRPGHVVSLQRIDGLGQIRGDGELRLGSTVTHHDIARSGLVRSRWPLLAAACGKVATPAIRNMGTIGGNLCYAEAASDPAPALLCLNAAVLLRGPGGERTLALERFFTGFYETAMEPTELLAEVRVPPPPAGARATYIKFSPRSLEDKPLVGVVALLALDGEGRCAEVGIGLGASAPTPMRARRAEAAIRGEAPTDAAIREAAEAAAAEADPLSDLQGSAEYRRAMVRVWVRRALTDLRDALLQGREGL